jgi:hypothetical protein
MKQGKKPMPKGAKIACVIIIIIAVLACVGVLGSSMSSSDNSSSSGDFSSTTTGKSSSKSDESTIGISDTLHAQSFDFTITSAKYYDSITNQLGVTTTPDEGNKYLLLVIKATNTTKEDQNVENVNFNSYIDDSKISPESITGEVDGYMPLLGAVSAGKNFEGYTVWQVPQNWNTFTFSYIDALTGEDSDPFTLHASDVQ